MIISLVDSNEKKDNRKRKKGRRMDPGIKLAKEKKEGIESQTKERKKRLWGS